MTKNKLTPSATNSRACDLEEGLSFSTYLEYSSEMIALLEFHQPLDTRLSIDEQAEHCEEHLFIRHCNDAFAQFYGFENAAAVEGQLNRNILAPDKSLASHRAAAELQFNSHNLKFTEHNLAGETLYLEYSGRGIYRDGLLHQILCTQRDITELHRQEQELRFRDQRFQQFVAKSHDAIGRLDLPYPLDLSLPADEQIEAIFNGLRLTECNQNWAEQYGFTEIEGILGKKLSEFEDETEFRAEAAEFVEANYEIVHREQHAITSEGLDIWLRYSCTGIIEDNFLHGMWIVQEDISAMMKEKMLREESEARNSAFFSQMFEPAAQYSLDKPMPINQGSCEEQLAWILNNMRFIAVNQALATVLGLDHPKEVIGRLDREVSPMTELDKIIWAAFVQSGYDLPADRIWHAELEDEDVYFHCSYRGVIKDGYLTGVWATYSDNTASQLQLREMEFQALHDALTGLPNRKALQQHLASQLPKACAKYPQALMLLDLDMFKEVNDALGHHVGDQLLQALGPRLQACCDEYSPGSMVARLGGDEFAINTSVDSPLEASFLADTLMNAIKQPFELDGISVHVGGSIGIALSPRDSNQAEDLMRYADVSMYRAKSASQGFAHYDATLDKQSSRRLQLLNELREAISRDTQVELHYQAKINLDTGQFCGAEALLRWPHPEQGAISPGEFIPLVETTDLIHPLTDWVLNTALKACKSWWQAEHPQPVAVNFSARNLLNPRICSQVKRALAEHKLPAQALEIEITESALMQNPSLALKILRQLQDLGVSIAIDDFGTGYSSMAYLKNLPVNTLKIDGSFITDMLSCREDRIIVDSVTSLGHNLGLHVVAECIEDQATLEHLQKIGCDIAQGYHVARPQPLSQMMTWLANQGEHDAVRTKA